MLSTLGAAQVAAGPITERGLTPAPDGYVDAHGRHYVVAIGIDHYQNWPLLNTAVSDATEFAHTLTTQFGFEYAVDPLTDKAATREAINSLIDDDLRNRLKPEDDLVIFFAGHGTTRIDKVGARTESVGFIVPVEARAPSASEHWSDYLNVEELLRNISTLPPAHILVILDSCHSGIALGSRFSVSRDDTRFRQDMLRKISRKVIASAEGDQLAADNGGPLSNHSLFTGFLLQGITSGKADSFHQGFITATQLGAYAQHEVVIAAGSRQTPLFGSFNLDDGGELIIPLGSGSAASGPATLDKSGAMLTRLEQIEVARLRKEDRRYWYEDDPLKNFPAARSAAIKLCDSGDAWGCGQAASSFRTGLGGGRDFARGIQLARERCDGKYSEACVTLGNIEEEGEMIRPDWASALRVYQQACDRGNLHGCADLGNLYRDGHGVGQDFGKALTLFTKACDGSEWVGCTNLAILYENGKGTAVDYERALLLWRKACDGGYLLACSNVGHMYETGRGVEKDAARAASYYREACSSGELFGCVQMGRLYRYGSSVGKDPQQAATLYRRACDGGRMEGCNGLASMIASGELGSKDGAAALAVYRKACDADDMNGCLGIGYLYETDQTIGPDMVRAAAAYGKACNSGQAEACTRLALLYIKGQGIGKDTAEGMALLRKTCDIGYANACATLGAEFATGTNLPQDYLQASKLLQKACDSGEGVGCRNLGVLYERGWGVQQDKDAAMRYYKKGCESGYTKACDDFKSLN